MTEKTISKKKNKLDNIDILISETLDNAPNNKYDSYHTANDMNDINDITQFLSTIQNKYSGNAEQKHLNQLYDIGIMTTNKNFDRDKLVAKLTKIIDRKSNDPIKKVREYKRKSLIEAFRQGIDDGLSSEYRMAYDGTNRYQYCPEKLRLRGHIDAIRDFI